MSDRPYRMLVERLWETYAWPEDHLPVQGLTPERLLQYPAEAEYVEDWERTPAWHYGRIRFFVEQLRAGYTLDPIEVDNFCHLGRIYPEPVLGDGHHRLAASHFAGVRFILAFYGGRVDLRRYLTGRRATCPTD